MNTMSISSIRDAAPDAAAIGLTLQPGEVHFYENLELYASSGKANPTAQAIAKALNLHLHMQTNAQDLAA